MPLHLAFVRPADNFSLENAKIEAIFSLAWLYLQPRVDMHVHLVEILDSEQTSSLFRSCDDNVQSINLISPPSIAGRKSTIFAYDLFILTNYTFIFNFIVIFSKRKQYGSITAFAFIFRLKVLRQASRM